MYRFHRKCSDLKNISVSILEEFRETSKNDSNNKYLLCWWHYTNPDNHAEVITQCAKFFQKIV